MVGAGGAREQGLGARSIVEIDFLVGIVELQVGLGGLHDSNNGKKNSVLVKVLQHLSAAELENFIIIIITPASSFNTLYSPLCIIMGQIILMIRFCLLALLLPAALSAWLPNWGHYIWPSLPQLSPSPFQIILTHPYLSASIAISTKSKLHQTFNSYNASLYESEGQGSVGIVSEGENINLIMSNKIDSFTVHVACFKTPCDKYTEKFIDRNLLRLKNDKEVKRACKLQEKQQSFHLACALKQTKELILKFEAENAVDLDIDIQKHQANFSARVQDFMTANKVDQIQNSSTSNNEMRIMVMKKALSELLTSICVEIDDGIRYLGFCDETGEYNFKLAALPIDLLSEYSWRLGLHIFRDFSTLLENRVSYPLSRRERNSGLPLPEHIQVFMTYTPPHMPMREADILNALFVQPMLSELGSLHQELNYREAKKFHPRLLQMLTQKWKTNSELHIAKSHYSESFTEDFKHHQYGEQLHQSIAKNSWIFKTIDTLTTILIRHYSAFMQVEQIKEHLQEYFTLLNLYKSFLTEDDNAKAGKYLDVVLSEGGNMFYSKSLGYGSILPYLYKAGNVFPTEAMKELDSPKGIKSSNLNNEPLKKYQGNIHAYYNYKILKEMIERISNSKLEPKVKQEYLNNLQQIGKDVAETIVENFKKTGKIYTSWTTGGEGREEVKWLAVVSGLLLRWSE